MTAHPRAPDAVRAPALVAADRLAELPRRRPFGGRRRLGLDLDVGPPHRDLRAVGTADLRGLEPALRARSHHDQGPARADGRRQHDPQPGADRQARDDPRPRLERPGGPRHRRRLVRAGARRLRHRVRRRVRRAPRPARRVGDADPPAARRRAVQPRGTLLHVPRRAVRAEARPAAPADPGRRLRPEEDAADRGRTGRRLEHVGHGRRGPGQARRSSPTTAPTSGATSARSRRRSASRSSSATIRQRPGPRSGPCSTTTGSPTWAQGRSCSGRRPRWPTRCGRIGTSASRRSSSGCPRRTTARRSGGCRRSRSDCGA